jgi:hypothetical protein
MNVYTQELKWLKDNGLNANNVYTLPSHLVKAQKIAHNLLKHNARLLGQKEAAILNNFLNAMSFANLREKLTEAECYKIMNIGKSVNRKLFKAHKALKR